MGLLHLKLAQLVMKGKGGLELLILQLLPPKCWFMGVYRLPSCCDPWLEIEVRASQMLDNASSY